jgi:multiple antibiotic resistance protein
MFETAAVALTTFFATMGPIDVAAMFAAITGDSTPSERRRMALKGVLLATGILLLFAFFGQTILDHLGISLAALRTAGGVLLLLIGIDMVFARPSGSTTTTSDEAKEAQSKKDISVFPLATPLIAGPGTMGAAVLLMANAEGDVALRGAVLLSMLAILVLQLLLLLGASSVSRVLGVTGLHVIGRVFGVLLAALAVQFIFDGVKESGILP